MHLDELRGSATGVSDYGVQRLEDDRTDCLNQATVEQMQGDPHTGTVFDKQEL